MPMSVEDDSRSQEGAGPRHGLLEDGTVLPVTDSDGSHQQHQYRHVSPGPVIYLAVKDTTHLPSPSPTPSPRSSSSSSVVTTDLSGEPTEILTFVPNPHRYSGILENPAHDSALEGNGEVTYPSPLPISTTSPLHELHDIPEERVKKPRKLSAASPNGEILKLSAAEMEELTSAPDSLPVTSPVKPSLAASPMFDRKGSLSDTGRSDSDDQRKMEQVYRPATSEPFKIYTDSNGERRPNNETPSNVAGRRPGLLSSRTISTPTTSSNRIPSYSKGSVRQPSPRRKPVPHGTRLEPLDLNSSSKPLPNSSNGSADRPTSPILPSIPLPPMSIPTYLQLELSSSRPSPLYIYRSATGDTPYESSKIKFERLLNFLLLPPQLEQVLYFGSLACLDAWLYTFTILPLRFFNAAAILIRWWGEVLSKEARFILGFIYHGAGRFWHRQRDRNGSSDSSSRSRSVSRARRPISSTSSFKSQSAGASGSSNGHGSHEQFRPELERKSRQGWGHKHRRTKSQPSSLSSNHKADLLQGAVIICTCIILMKLDASRMYHNIRGQSAIKLYVIYNALEVCQLVPTTSFC